MLSRTSRHGTCPNIRIASTLENVRKIHQTQEQLTPSLGLNSQLHTSKRYAKYKPANILIPLDRQLIVLQSCRWEFLYNETLQQTFRPLLSKLVWKTTNLGIWYPFSGSQGRCRTLVGGSIYDFLFVIIKLFSLALTVEALQAKTCQDSLSGKGGPVWAKISAGRGWPLGIFFGSYKTRHILLSDSANYTMLRAIVLSQYRRVTDGRTDR